MKLQNLGDAGVWNFETLPYDFASQFPVSNQPFATVVDQVAPGIVSYAQSIATAGETLLSAVLRARSSVSMNDAQRQLLDIQLQRAQAGLFLAMQYPVEVPGVSVSNFLRTSATAVRGEAPKLRLWIKEMKEAMASLQMDPSFAERNVNEGFSGGEKKRHEILQMELLHPKIAILDETDSGLDVDALRIVSEGVNAFRESSDAGTLLITHYTRILRYISPDVVHVFVDGRIVESGGPELAEVLESEGYERFVQTPAS